jgi:Tfp pilus assembly protein PilO
MADTSFINDLPLTTQIVVNVSIGLLTLVIGLKSYYSGKKGDKESSSSETIVSTNHVKFLEDVGETMENVSADIHRIANSLDLLEKNMSHKLKQDEIDREVRRLTGNRPKRGSTRKPTIEKDIDTSD